MGDESRDGLFWSGRDPLPAEYLWVENITNRDLILGVHRFGPGQGHHLATVLGMYKYSGSGEWGDAVVEEVNVREPVSQDGYSFERIIGGFRIEYHASER